jgi:hypothetical protein
MGYKPLSASGSVLRLQSMWWSEDLFKTYEELVGPVGPGGFRIPEFLKAPLAHRTSLVDLVAQAANDAQALTKVRRVKKALRGTSCVVQRLPLSQLVQDNHAKHWAWLYKYVESEEFRLTKEKCSAVPIHSFSHIYHKVMNLSTISVSTKARAKFILDIVAETGGRGSADAHCFKIYTEHGRPALPIDMNDRTDHIIVCDDDTGRLGFVRELSKTLMYSGPVTIRGPCFYLLSESLSNDFKTTFPDHFAALQRGEGPQTLPPLGLGLGVGHRYLGSPSNTNDNLAAIAEMAGLTEEVRQATAGGQTHTYFRCAIQSELEATIAQQADAFDKSFMRSMMNELLDHGDYVAHHYTHPLKPQGVEVHVHHAVTMAGLRRI